MEGVQGRKEQKEAPGGSALRGCWHLPLPQGCGHRPANRAAQGQRRAGLHGPGRQSSSWSPGGGDGPAGGHPGKEWLCCGSPVVRGQACKVGGQAPQTQLEGLCGPLCCPHPQGCWVIFKRAVSLLAEPEDRNLCSGHWNTSRASPITCKRCSNDSC